jgi:hypothetical protein
MISMLCRFFGLDRIRRSALETLEHVVAPLLTVPALDIGELLLAGPQLDPANLARDRLRQLEELDPAHALPRLQVLARMGEDRAAVSASGSCPGASAM